MNSLKTLGSALFPPAMGIGLLVVLHRLSETTGGAAVNVAGMIVGMATMILGIRGISMISTTIRDRYERRHERLQEQEQWRHKSHQRYLVLRVDVWEPYCPEITAVRTCESADEAFDRAQDIKRSFEWYPDPEKDGFAVVIDLLTLETDMSIESYPVKRGKRHELYD